MKNSWKLSRRRGWLRAVNLEQREAWEDYCFENDMDCITVSDMGRGFSLSCTVNPEHPFSQLGYLELREMMNSLQCPTWSMGGSSSTFSLEHPNQEMLEEVLSQLREILRRDRTPRRCAELQAHPGPKEGMAQALDSTGLWEDHQPDDFVYVLEMEGRPGRCLVFKHLKPTLVDFPLSSFRILPTEET